MTALKACEQSVLVTPVSYFLEHPREQLYVVHPARHCDSKFPVTRGSLGATAVPRSGSKEPALSYVLGQRGPAGTPTPPEDRAVRLD